LRLKPGDTLVTDTVDARGYDSKSNPIPDGMKQQSEETEYYPANPLVGPFYVEDAELGDTLVVEIKKIKLNRKTGWSRINTNFGSLTEEGPGKRLLLNEPLDERYFPWMLNLEKKVAVLNLEKSKLGRIEVPLHPHYGFSWSNIPTKKTIRYEECLYTVYSTPCLCYWGREHGVVDLGRD